jgi:transcription termination factor NusB
MTEKDRYNCIKELLIVYEQVKNESNPEFINKKLKSIIENMEDIDNKIWKIATKNTK